MPEQSFMSNHFNKLRILYIIHNDWCWIKQRSHFLSEELISLTNCDVRYKFSFRRKLLISNPKPMKCRGLFMLPFSMKRFLFLKKLDIHIWSIYFRILDRFKRYNAIIITHPLLFDYISWHNNIVYDLHDDNEEFYGNCSYLRNEIKLSNSLVLEKAAAVVFSSNHLFNKYRNQTRTTLRKIVRNGHSINREIDPIHSNEISQYKTKKLFYFGTISQWFDQGLIEKCIYTYKDIEFHLIGPSDVSLRKLPRVYYYGSMPHHKMLEISNNADCFIMPFKINELMKSVDPVKVYEYISFNKPILIPYYEEVLHFSDFVHFYRDHNEFVKLINELRNNKLPTNSPSLVQSFLQNSLWSERVKSYINVLKEVIVS